MGFQNVNEKRLQELRDKHRAAVIAAVEERSKGLRAWRDSQGLASKLYGFKHDPKSMLAGTDKVEGSVDKTANGDLSRSNSDSVNADGIVISLTGDLEIDSGPDLQEQVLCAFVLLFCCNDYFMLERTKLIGTYLLLDGHARCPAVTRKKL